MKHIKYFKVLVFAVLILCLNGCGGNTRTDKNVSKKQEYSETIVQDNKLTEKNQKKSNSSVAGIFISIVGLALSGYCLYEVRKEKNEIKYMLKARRHHSHVYTNNHNNEAYERISDSIQEVDKHISKINLDIAKLRDEINVLKTKDTVKTSFSYDYSGQIRETQKQSLHNSINYKSTQHSFKDVVEEYNYYINTDTGLSAKFEKLNFQAKNNELFHKEDGEALLYIMTGDSSDISNDKIYYIFPSKRIREKRVQGFVCDAFDIIGDGNKVRVSTPCSARKMSTKYEIIEKGKVYLE